MNEVSEFEEQMADQVQKAITEALPDDLETIPHRCAACGTPIYQGETENLYSPLSLPIETVQLMKNSDELDSTEHTESVRLQFCENHWAALQDWIDKSEGITFRAFDATYAVPGSTGSLSKDRWDQSKLRMARSLIQGKRDPISENPYRTVSERLEATLLVSAVDYYDIEYSPTESAKPALARSLRDQGHGVEILRDPFIDIKINVEGLNEPVVGTINSISLANDSNPEGPLPTRESNPERLVSNTIYCSMLRDAFDEYSSEEYPNAQYISFYWITDQDLWTWYPVSSESESDQPADSRTNLPIQGPTGTCPALGLDLLSPETITVESYEQQLKERWTDIESERSIKGRVRDAIYRYLN